LSATFNAANNTVIHAGGVVNRGPDAALLGRWAGFSAIQCLKFGSPLRQITIIAREA
jgi:hypothetical protein